jgi:hypothetical protein
VLSEKERSGVWIPKFIFDNAKLKDFNEDSFIRYVCLMNIHNL